MPEFKKRKEARLRKLEEQRKFDRRANAVRSRQEGYHVPSYYDEPEVNLNLADTNDFPCSISSDNGEKQMAQFAPEDHQPVGPSFAQMLKAEGSLPPVKIKSNWGQRKGIFMLVYQTKRFIINNLKTVNYRSTRLRFLLNLYGRYTKPQLRKKAWSAPPPLYAPGS